VYTNNSNVASGFGSLQFKITFSDSASTPPSQTTTCISVTASASAVKTAINNALSSFSSAVSYSLGVEVTDNLLSLDTVNARDGRVFTIYFLNEGAKPAITTSQCGTPSLDWSVTPEMVRPGALHGLTRANSGVVQGIVTRGDFTDLFVTGETNPPASANLKWNAPAEGVNSIKSYLETISGHKVNVKRIVIGKYGVVEYEIRFVRNPGNYPPGTGDIPILTVVQAAANQPVVYERVKGST